MIQIEDNEIRESGLTFFYNLANAIGSEFEQIFDKIIDFTFNIA